MQGLGSSFTVLASHWLIRLVLALSAFSRNGGSASSEASKLSVQFIHELPLVEERLPSYNSASYMYMCCQELATQLGSFDRRCHMNTYVNPTL